MSTVQEAARRMGRMLIVAAAHEDLFSDLKRGIWIQKKFGNPGSLATTIFPEPPTGGVKEA